jgi:hypothetical protein
LTLKVGLGKETAAANYGQRLAECSGEKPKGLKPVLQKSDIVGRFPPLEIREPAKRPLALVMKELLHLALVLEGASFVQIALNLYQPQRSTLFEKFKRKSTKS